MAEGTHHDRTEPATPKRKAEARRKGQVALSRDATAAMLLLGAITGFYWFIPLGFQHITQLIQARLSFSMDPSSRRLLSLEHVHLLVHTVGIDVLLLLLPIVAGVAVIGIGSTVAQIGLVWKQDAFQWDLTKLNPLSGLSRMVSVRAVAELVKAIFKILAIGAAGAIAIYQDLDQFGPLVQYELPAFLNAIGATISKVTLYAGVAAAVIGLLDFAYQRYEWERGLRMTRQEVKEEQRESEGDPLIRSRVRTVQRDMARKRMMADVPKADVVVTNPTEIAVALWYDQGSMAAPVVVAKGSGFIAERIREIAKQHGVMLVENKVVARTLYKLVDVGKEIPHDLYRAVAEILAFVYRMRGTAPMDMHSQGLGQR